MNQLNWSTATAEMGPKVPEALEFDDLVKLDSSVQLPTALQEKTPTRTEKIDLHAPDDPTSLLAKFGAKGHANGMALSQYVFVGSAVALKAGQVLYEQFQIFGGQGRDSQFPEWLKTYAPDLGRKTADRWRSLYGMFHNEYAQNPAIFDKFQLTALYLLLQSTAEVRARAFALAEREPVTAARISSLMAPGNTPAKKSKGKTSPSRKTRTTPGAAKNVSIQVAIREVLYAQVARGVPLAQCVAVLRVIANDLARDVEASGVSVS